MSGLVLRPAPETGFSQVVGVGGIGTGMIVELEGNQTLGRNESRMGRALNARDHCKLHIVEHYIAVLMGAGESPNRFRVFAVGNVGDDAAGVTLIREMTDAGIDTRYVRVETEYKTLFSLSFLYPDRSGGNITTSNSAACALDGAQLHQCRHELAAGGGNGVALCLPEVPLDARREFLRVATECGSYRVASFTCGEMETVLRLKLLSQVDLLALNHEEAAAVAGSAAPAASPERLLDVCSEIATTANPTMRVLVSAGADGVYILERGTWSHRKAVPMEAVSTAGAGDALLAGTISGLAAGLPLIVREDAVSEDCGKTCSAIDLGCVLASFSLASPHTIHPQASLETLLSFAREKGLEVSENVKHRVSHGGADYHLRSGVGS